MNRPFAARYKGRCRAECGEVIEQGDQIVMTEGAVFHEDCAREEPPEIHRAICPKCWLEKPCECDE